MCHGLPPRFPSLQEQRSNAEIDLIRQTLRQTDGNKAKAARILGIDRTRTLHTVEPRIS
ncbi:MAG: helix-turn-helix domain-containing protein [Lachnospiraceae bacterium]